MGNYHSTYINNNSRRVAVVYFLRQSIIMMVEKIVVNWVESIACCNYVMIELKEKVRMLEESLDDILKTNDTKQLKKFEEFYASFQEAYDLYFFLYLGHFLRTEHHYKQPTVSKNHMKLLKLYLPI